MSFESRWVYRASPSAVTAAPEAPNARPRVTVHGVRELEDIGENLRQLVALYEDAVATAEKDPRRGHLSLARMVEVLQERIADLAEKMQPVARRDSVTGTTKTVAFLRRVS